MRDGMTQKLKSPGEEGGIAEFLRCYRAKIVALTGRHTGQEYPLVRERLTLGRGPGVDLVFDNPAISRQHAAVEFVDGAFQVRDLGSTNGLMLNGRPVQVALLGHGDRFELGGQCFQLVIETRQEEPETYELSVDI
jgi:pSer/pThr/pTyr-binding forkhead associated (FHA) protein